MQTFLPYRSFKESAACLDDKRLGKQRSEVLIIARTNIKRTVDSAWYNHPAVKMWRKHEPALLLYGIAVCQEWRRRGFRDTVFDKLWDMFYEHFYHTLYPSMQELPSWLGDERLHASHRSNLLRKNHEHYSQFEWTEPDNLPYFWPVK